MSAALAQVPPRPQRKGGRPLPEWTASQKWVAVPQIFFTHLPKCLSQLELAILGLILTNTAGDPNRPEWARLSQPQLAKFCDVTVNGVAKAIDALEHHGAVESREVGKYREYRCRIETWAQLQPKGPRKLERKPPTSVDESSESSAVDAAEVRGVVSPLRNEPLVILPGAKKPRPVSEVCTRPDCSCPIHGAHEQIPQLQLGDEKAKVDSSPQLQLGDEYAKFRAQVADILRPRLGIEPPDAMLRPQFDRLHAIGAVDYFWPRLHLRADKIRSYGIIPNLVDDVLNSFSQAASAPETVSTSKVERTLGNAALEYASHDGYEEVVAALHATIDRQKGPDALSGETLYLHVENIEHLAIEIAESRMTAAERQEVHEIVAAATEPYRATLSKADYDRHLSMTRKHTILRVAGLPAIEW